MATTADFKNGLYISFNGKPCQVVYFQHVKPGKGPAFVKTKLRNLENGRILENTFTAGMKIDVINVERRPYQFLYSDEDGFNFMHEETYEQIHLPHDVVENSDLMKEGQHVEMMFVTEPEEKCLTCELPTYVELEVTYAEPAVKGNTASTSALKEVTLETARRLWCLSSSIREKGSPSTPPTAVTAREYDPLTRSGLCGSRKESERAALRLPVFSLNLTGTPFLCCKITNFAVEA